jgi:hypothetical protein
MSPDVMHIVSNLGLGGILFFMWWNERKDRQAKETESKHDAHVKEQQILNSTTQTAALLKVIQDNTEAMTSLKEKIGQLDNRPCLYEFRERTSA